MSPRACTRCINGRMFWDTLYLEWQCLHCGHTEPGFTVTEENNEMVSVMHDEKSSVEMRELSYTRKYNIILQPILKVSKLITRTRD